MKLNIAFSGKFWLTCLVFVVSVWGISTVSAAIDPENVVGLWLFDEGKGNVATDASENGLDGEFKGSPKWIDGKFGKGLELDGKSAYVQIPGHDNPNDAITVSIWVKSLSPTWNENGWMVEKRPAYIIHPNSGTQNVSWPVCNGGCWNKPGEWRDGEIGPGDIEEWHMYTTTFDSESGEWYIYIDGKMASDMKIAKNPLDADSGPVNIGFDDCCGGTRYGSALVDEVVILDVALEEADIQEMYDQGLYLSVLAVEPADKMTTTWSNVEIKY